MERRDADRHGMAIHIVPFHDVFGFHRPFSEHELAGSSLPRHEFLLASQHRREVLVRLHDGLDEVVDLEVDLLPHLLDSTDHFSGVRFRLQIRRDAKVEVELAVGGRDSDHLGGHRLLETDHGRFDRHDLALHPDLEVSFVEGLLDFVRGPRFEELYDLGLQHAVGLADRRRIGLDDECHPGELLRLFQDGQGFRIRLFEEDAAHRFERGRRIGRGILHRNELQRPAQLPPSLLSFLRHDLDEFLDDAHGSFEIRLDSFLLCGRPIDHVDAQLFPVEALVDRLRHERRCRREQERERPERLKEHVVRRELIAVLRLGPGPATN